MEPTGGVPVAPAPEAGAAAGAAAAGAGAEAAGARAEGAGWGAAAPTEGPERAEGRAPLQVPPSFGGNMVLAASHWGCAPTGAAMPCGSHRGRHAQRSSERLTATKL